MDALKKLVTKRKFDPAIVEVYLAYAENKLVSPMTQTQ
jgi:hypothetical protein